MRLRGLVVLVVSVGCYREAPARREPSAYAELAARMPKALDALGRLRESLRGAGGDCAQLARSLRTFASAHASTLPQLRALMLRLNEQERERFEYEHHDDHALLDDLFAMSASCPGDAEVAAAFAMAGFRKP